MRLLTKISIIPTVAILFAVPPDWEETPGDYQYFATLIGGIVLNDGVQLGNENDGDIFAAFDANGIVRGVAFALFPTFGTYEGTCIYEMQMWSNSAGDFLHFKYYDASEDVVLDIAETYEFSINDILGDADILNPMEFNIEFITLTFNNISSMGIDINYESNTEISGFQFNVDGVDITGASGGAAGDAGFMISSSATTILAFSIAGATIPIGSGKLLSLEFERLNGDNTLDINNVVISGPGGNSIPSVGPGSIDITAPPELFEFNQSILQAFYFFKLVLINDTEVESNDWVGAFNGNICVGARKWDVSLCNAGICEVPVMGDYGDELTEGYMQFGDMPIFKIYDSSKNSYYTAESSENSGWINNNSTIAELLSVYVSVPGCTDPDYCNYDSSATEDDGSCNYLCTGCTVIGSCNYSENATIDDGSCYDAEENYDCAGNCIAELDCAGFCGGSIVLDLCGECENYIATNGIQPDFPYGDCDCLGANGGSAYNDNCGECDDNPSNDCVKDCSGAWGGDLVIDECGVCDGPGSISGCGCSDIQIGFCDCEGNELDQCGICNGDNSTCDDCAGVPNGASELDNCNICDNDSTNDCMQDCGGSWGGSAVMDDCGICDNDITNDCIKDCAGIWGGTAMIDECGICNGDGPEENYDCGGNCTGEINCLGECDSPNSQYSPHFQCENGNVVCNAAGCNSLDISPYLLPDEFGISKVFPNPFNPITQIQYKLKQFGFISIKIYDIQGRVIDQLIHKYQNPGHYSLNWNAVKHASGMYIVEILMQLENNEISRDLQKILYLK